MLFQMKKNSFLKKLLPFAKYLRPHKKVLIISMILSFMSTALGIVQPLFTKVIIDKVLIGHDYQFLFVLLGALVALLLISFLTRVGNNYIYTKYSSRILFKMREDLFDHIHRLPLTYFSKKKIGDIYSRIASDISNIQALITDTIPICLYDIITCIITIAILLWLNWKMALLSFLFLPVGMKILLFIRSGIIKLSEELAESNAEIAHFLVESVGGSTVIRSLGAEKLECNKLREKHSRLLKILLRYQVLGGVSGSIPTLYKVVNTIILFGYGGVLVMKGLLSIGDLVAFSMYQGRIFGYLQGLMGSYLDIQKSKVSISRVNEIIEVKPVNQSGGDIFIPVESIRGEIIFDHVQFDYEEDEGLFADLSFTIPSGKITAIVGPSGVGKSTICFLMMGLIRQNSGVIMLDGIDITRIETECLRNAIAFVPQDVFLFHTTILENLMFSTPDATKSEVVEACKAACIHEFIESLPNKYDTIVGDRGIRLSGGQKQRIGIARAILSNPKILILDEATAFLDASCERRLKDTIRRMMKGRTVIIISHRLSAIQDVEKIISIKEGRVVFEGSPICFFNNKDHEILSYFPLKQECDQSFIIQKRHNSPVIKFELNAFGCNGNNVGDGKQ